MLSISTSMATKKSFLRCKLIINIKYTPVPFLNKIYDLCQKRHRVKISHQRQKLRKKNLSKKAQKGKKKTKSEKKLSKKGTASKKNIKKA